MKLYSDKRAPNPRRVRIFLAEKGIDDVEIVNLDIGAGEHQSDEFLAVNPLGWLPVLELDNGVRIAESVAICRFFEETKPTPPLFGMGAQERAVIEQWNRHVEFEIFMPITAAFRNGHPYWADRIAQAPAYAEISKKLATQRFDWLDQSLAHKPWIAGETFSIADITALAAIDFGRLPKIRIGENRPHLAHWYEAVNARPSSKA